VHYTPREDVGTGEDFDNSYLKTYRTINTYEYNENSNICINRIYHDVYDPEDIHQETYERTLHKYETLYEGDRITSILYMTAPAGENWIEQDRYSFTYSGNLLQSVKSNGRTLEFTYNGTVPATVTDGETQYTYKFDGNGNVTEINDGQGNFMKITYESGHGNFSVFTPVIDQMLGKPFIK